MPKSAKYVTDVPYAWRFHRELAPAWLDCIATLCGTASPDRGEGFSWCDLGCGRGLTAIVLAATHPAGRFVGVDLMPPHVALGSRLAKKAEISNLEFHNADFASADLAGSFDYIVSHGVYAWIDGASRAAMLRLIDRHLAPGGLVYLSYNAMPGWAADLPLQRLLLALAESQAGDSISRFRAAAQVARRIGEAGAPSIAASPIAGRLDELEQQMPPAYLAHEYLAPHWQPLFVTEVRAAMAEIGLSPVGSATFADNFDSFVLRRAERAVLRGIEGAERRELVRDFLTHQRFRRDVFARDAKTLDEEKQREQLLAGRYALTCPVGLLEFAMRTPAGRLKFDNKVTRTIVSALVDGPRPVSPIVGEIEPADLVSGLLALCCSGGVRPVENRDAPVAAINRAILRQIAKGEEIDAVVLPCGTALRVDPAVLRALRNGKVPDDPNLAQWYELLMRYGSVIDLDRQFAVP